MGFLEEYDKEIFDLCEKDIVVDDYYLLNCIKVSGKLRLGYFKLNISNDIILKKILKALEQTETEEKLRELRDNITKEISVRTKKGVSY